jgi:2,3-bisphosphoglycerate-dependent phosphoglycerate mutase
MQKSKLILLRHGQSEWNKRNLFTGWVDIPLSYEGIQESLVAGEQIADVPIDVIFVSSLIRSQMTAMIALSVHRKGKVPVMPHTGHLQEWATIYSPKATQETIPVIIAWQLNERMYGELQGLNKQETREKFGEEQVHIWRRSYDVAPPGGESLADTAARSIPYFKQAILPYLQEGKTVLVAAHGNSLRSIAMHLEGLTKEEVTKLELSTGVPLVYHHDKGQWRRE